MVVEPRAVETVAVSSLPAGVTFNYPLNPGIYMVAAISSSGIVFPEGTVPGVRLADGALFGFPADAQVVVDLYKAVPG